MTDKSTVGERLKVLRGSRGKTIEEASRDIGISASALSMYENGARTPRDEVKERIANYYKRSIAFIFFS